MVTAKNSDDVERSSNTNKQDEDNDQREERQSTEQSEAKGSVVTSRFNG